MPLCVSVRVFVHACVCVRVCACVGMCVRVRACQCVCRGYYFRGGDLGRSLGMLLF